MNPVPTRCWQFRNPVHVCFGAGSRAALPPLIKGQRILVVTTRRGRAQFLADPVLKTLANTNITWVDSVASNPGLVETQAEIDRLASQTFDQIIAFGGGSAMDVAKALSAALTPGLRTHDLAALIARPNDHLDRPLVPVHAVPTTAGTGAEVTPFATIWDHSNHKKFSLASPRLFPVTAVVDPELTYNMPELATFSTGLDAMNQAFESVWNRNRTPLTILMAARAIPLALEALPRLKSDLTDHKARALIAEASLLAGMCISQTRTALCHSISYPITAHFDMPHGLACTFSMSAIAQAVLADAPQGLDDVARLSGQGDAAVLVGRLDAVLDTVGLSTLTARWLPEPRSALLDLCDEMVTPGRADNFVLPVDTNFLADIISKSVDD